MAILTLDNFLSAAGVNICDLDDIELKEYEFALDAAAAAVESEIGEFELASGAYSDRLFDIDPSGVVDIDPCVDIEAIDVISYNVTDLPLVESRDWTPYPLNGPVYTWVQYCGGYGFGSSEMGFTSNLDVYARESRYCAASRLRITADWGYDEVPNNLTLAVLWTAMAVKQAPGPFISESIEGYSRTRGDGRDVTIPDRAQALLIPFQGIHV